MQTVSYFELLQQTCALCGLPDPSVQDLDDGKWAMLARFHRRRLRQCHEMGWFSETMRCEERFYRADYASGTAYTVGHEVYYPATQSYYRALRSTTGNAPATLSGTTYTTNAAYWIASTTTLGGADWADATAYTVGTIVRNPANGSFYACHTAHTSSGSLNTSNFGLLGAWSPTISLDQVNGSTTLTPIGKVRGVFSADTLSAIDAGRVPYCLSTTGIELLGERVPRSVWVWFQVRAAKLHGEDFSATGTYAVGQTMFYSSTTAGYEGDFWTCVTATSAGNDPEDAAAKWSKEAIPAVLADAVASFASADYLRAQGARDQAAIEEAAANEFLSRALINEASNQDRSPRWRAA